MTDDLSLAKSLLEKHPLIIKPHMGHRGAGVSLCKTPEDIDKIPKPVTPMIIQEAIPGPGEDLKIYCVGDQVQGVRKQFSESSFSVAGVTARSPTKCAASRSASAKFVGLGFTVWTSSKATGALRCGRELFPGYKGVPNAAGMIADYIDDYAKAKSH